MVSNMTEQRKEEAIKYIESQLEDGYLDLGLHDQDELEIIREAMKFWKDMTKFMYITHGGKPYNFKW